MFGHLLALSFALFQAHAEPALECGAAKVVSGDTCSNVKVELSFAGCAHKGEPQLAKKVVCEGQTIKARLATDHYSYEAQFTKVTDGWNSVRWNPIGGMKQTKKVDKTAASAPSEARTPAAAAPPALPPAVPPGASAGDVPPSTFKFSAFFDARYSIYDAGSNSAVNNDHSETGFALEDGAFYGNYDQNQVAVVVDIAFRRGKASDTNSTSSAPNASENANLAVGWDKSQIYVRYKAMDGLVIDFGQFDTIYGVELNDSKDRAFGKTGLVYDLTLPVTHTGLMLEYLNNGAYGKLFAANPNNKGTNGTSAKGDESTEYGAAVGYSNERFRGQLGYMTRPMTKADGLTRGDRTLADLTLGVTFGQFVLDFEYSMVGDPNKNTLTTQADDEEDSGTGFLALAQYKVTNDFLVGLRYEAIQDDPVADSTDKATSMGAVVHYTLNQNIELRAEFNGYNYERVNGDKFYDSRANAATVVRF